MLIFSTPIKYGLAKIICSSSGLSNALGRPRVGPTIIAPRLPPVVCRLACLLVHVGPPRLPGVSRFRPGPAACLSCCRCASPPHCCVGPTLALLVGSFLGELRFLPPRPCLDSFARKTLAVSLLLRSPVPFLDWVSSFWTNQYTVSNH
jgi:hypothetical protein